MARQRADVAGPVLLRPQLAFVKRLWALNAEEQTSAQLRGISGPNEELREVRQQCLRTVTA